MDDVIDGSAVGARGMLYNPFIGLRQPLMITLPFLKMLAWCLDKIDTQSSSDSCPNENSVPVLRSLYVYPCWALSESLSEIWDFTCLTDCVSSPFSVYNGFGVSGSETSLQYSSALRSP